MKGCQTKTVHRKIALSKVGVLERVAERYQGLEFTWISGLIIRWNLRERWCGKSSQGKSSRFLLSFLSFLLHLLGM